MCPDRLRFAVLGHPVGHSLSPAMHAAAYRALGLPHVYEARDVPDRLALESAFADLAAGRLAGANVTLPHKRAALELADRVAPSAAEAGAANVLARECGVVVAHNTDVAALEAELADGGGLPADARAFVVGGGGAALAAVVACRRLGCREVVATSRSFRGADPAASSAAASRLEALGATVVAWPLAERSPATGVLDIVVQATSAGMLGADPGDDVAAAVPWASLSPHARVYDVVYRPAVTPFLARARAAGFRARGGLGMLVRQAALSFHHWLGVDPPIDVLRGAAERALAEAGGA
jgi:shikimate dehydrogenase